MRERARRRRQMQARAERAAKELAIYKGKRWSENYGGLSRCQQIDRARRILRLEREAAGA